MRFIGLTSLDQLLKSPTTETLLAWGAQTRKIYPLPRPRFAGWQPISSYAL